MEGYGLYWFCIELVAMNVTSKKLTFELEHDGRIIARMTGMPVAKVDALMKCFIELDLFSASEGRIQCLKLAQRSDDFTSKAIRQNGIQALGALDVRECPTKSDKVPLEDRSKKLEDRKEIEDRFSEFWDLYAKKVDTKKCKAKFLKLKLCDVDKIFEVLPDYIASTPDKQYRKLPLTWLNGECWNDEIQKTFEEVVYADVDYEQLAKDFNESMEGWPLVPLVVKVTEKQKAMITNLIDNFEMTEDRFKRYFDHISSTEKFRYFVDGVNMPAQGLTFFLKEDTIQR